MSANYKPRLSIEITTPQHLALSKIMEFGVKKAIFSALIDEVLRLYKKHGVKALTGILERKVVLAFSDTVKEETTYAFTHGPKASILGAGLRRASCNNEGNPGKKAGEQEGIL